MNATDIGAGETFIYTSGNAITAIHVVRRKAEDQLRWYILILFLVVGVPYIIGQVIYEQWGVVGCLAPLVGCGGLFGLSVLFKFKEDNGDTKISFETPARDEKSHEIAVMMVRQMVGKQIRLVSVHWSEPERYEYLYTSRTMSVDWTEKRDIFSWKVEPTNDILSKSRYRVEFVHSTKEEEIEEENWWGAESVPTEYDTLR